MPSDLLEYSHRAAPRGGNHRGHGHHLTGGDGVAERTCSIPGCGTPLDRRGARGWCHAHYTRWRRHGDPLAGRMPNRTTLAERLWPHVDKNGPVSEHQPDLGPCWVWTDRLTPAGYGVCAFGGWKYVHRLTYELLVGPIPDGLEIDHLCRVRRCCNPAHLEPVTHQENVRRGNIGQLERNKTHCPHGHPLDGRTVKRGLPTRYCMTCARERSQRLRDAARPPGKVKNERHAEATRAGIQAWWDARRRSQ